MLRERTHSIWKGQYVVILQMSSFSQYFLTTHKIKEDIINEEIPQEKESTALLIFCILFFGFLFYYFIYLILQQLLLIEYKHFHRNTSSNNYFLHNFLDIHPIQSIEVTSNAGNT
jgi:hypothetical protein